MQDQVFIMCAQRLLWVQALIEKGGRGLEKEIEAEYIVGGMTLWCLSVFPPMHPELQEVLTLTVVEDTKQRVSIDQSTIGDWKYLT